MYKRQPYIGRDDQDTISRHLEDELPWPQDFVPELSDEISQVVARMLVKDPEHRYKNPKEVIYDLEALLDDRPPAFASGTTQSPFETPRDVSPQRGMRPHRSGPGGRRSGLAPTGRHKRVHRRARPKAQNEQTTTIWLLAGIGIIILLAVLVIVLAASG